MWEYQGQARPPFADAVGPGQESVWDYPRPPAIVPDHREVIVRSGGTELARTDAAIRVLMWLWHPALLHAMFWLAAACVLPH